MVRTKRIRKNCKKSKRKLKGGNNEKKIKYLMINLEDRKKHYDEMKDKFLKNNTELNHFKAIDTRKLDTRIFDVIPNIERFLNNKDNEDGYNTRYKDEIIHDRRKLGSLGCTLSHISLLKNMIKNNDEFVCVLEDDAILDKQFFEKIQKALNDVPEDWDIIFLGFSCAYSHDNRCKKNDSIKKIKDNIHSINYIYGSYGYLINNKGARKIIDNIYPIWWHVDTMYSFLIQKGILNSYCTIPNLIFHPGKFSISSVKYETDTPYTSYISTLNTSN